MQLDSEVVQRPASHRDKPGGVLQQAVTLRDFNEGGTGGIFATGPTLGHSISFELTHR